MRHRVALLLLGALCAAGCASSSHIEEPFQFGLFSDVQYADKDAAGSRRYRESLTTLEMCVDDLRQHDLSFVVHCGDIIDGRATLAESREDLESVLALFARLECDVRHVIGNHCLEIPRAELEERLGLTRSYDSFTRGHWRFIVVDALALSTCGVPAESASHRQATLWMQEHGAADEPNVQPWNGGLGEVQREWLRHELASAEEAQEHVVVFSHLPIIAEASTAHHLLWDREEVLEILDDAPAFTAWINGHDHAGGFALRRGRAFLTVPGMVEADPSVNSYAIVEVHPDRLVLHGVGNTPSRTIEAPETLTD